MSALQDRYALKKSANSASVGVGAIGSLSLPFSGGDDSLVKVASETITAPNFYDRFFRLLSSYLEKEPEPVQAPMPPRPSTPASSSAPAASAPAAAASAPAATPASAPAALAASAPA